MKFTLEMSDEIAVVDGVECRIWNGHEESTGVPVRVYVHRVAVPLGSPQDSFKLHLLEREQPTSELIGRVKS